jgi:mercuric ion transport protein
LYHAGMEKEATHRTGGERLLAATALLSAIAASSCCVLPLLFVSVGISGAWIGSLTVLAPYQPIFLATAAVCIAAGFWSVYRRSQAACAGRDCGTPESRRATKAALWVGVVVLLVAGSAEWWARLLT